MADLPSWARVGANVICINSRPRPGFVEWLSFETITEGAIYTVREIFIGPTGVPCFKLRGITRRIGHECGFGELGYGVYRFRPAVEPKSEAHDLALFKSWLPHNETEPA